MLLQEKKSNLDKIEKYIDIKTLLLTLLLVFIGIAVIYSGTALFDKNLIFFNKQILSALIGVGFMIIFAFLPSNFIKSSSIFIYILSIAILLFVLFFGKTIYGTRGWLIFGSFSFQPAELAKVATLLMLSKYLSKYNSNVNNIVDFSIMLGIVLLPFILILLQPDFGSAVVLIIIFVGILFWGGFDIYYLYLISAMLLTGIVALKGINIYLVMILFLSLFLLIFRKKIYMYIIGVILITGSGIISHYIYDILAPHQQARIDVFLNPGLNPQGIGYNVLQSILAVGSGGIIGKGYLQGTLTQLRYVPMQWTDFIFSIPAEEFGLFGATILILFLLMMVHRAGTISYLSKDKFFSTLSFGIASMFLFHIFVNVGMVIGIFPVMGITLPFISQGGTSLIINMSLAGLLMNAYRGTKK